MTYTISGLDPSSFLRLYGLDDGELRESGVIRMPVTSPTGFPCRVRLEEAAPGEHVLLINHVSHDVANPFRATHAIFVTEGATTAALYQDEIPPVLDSRVLSLRAFDSAGMMIDAMLVLPGEADVGIRRLFDSPETSYIHAHNAVRGCFAAKVDRR